VAIIVLADDSAELRAVYSPLLRTRGHAVHEAADGVQALELVRAHRPDLLILDVWMPRLGGFEVLDALRFEPAAARTRVLMLSVLGDADSQLDAYGSGAAAYLVKGLSLAEFLARVEATLAEGPIPALPESS
jgi:DNA-binding response OmpR family regulator